MNIISNNCFGGHTYKYVLEKEYENPFIWTRLYNNDLIYLLEHFNELNFHNFCIEKKQQNLLFQFFVNIDGKIHLEMKHYKFHPNYSTPTKIGADVFYNKIWEYVSDVYEKRLARMSNKIDAVLLDDDCFKYDVFKIKEICERLKIKLIICTNKIPKIKTDLLLVLSRNQRNFDVDPLNICKTYKNEIKEFLEIK